jgi:hypothetical protein
MEFQNRSPYEGGSFYPLWQNGTVYIGGSPYDGDYCSCYLQYARVYIDYFPNSLDEMINLAIMEAGIMTRIFLYQPSHSAKIA